MTDGNDSGLERQRQSGFRSKMIKRWNGLPRSGPVRAVGASQPFQSVEKFVQLVGDGLPPGLRGRFAGWKFRRTPGVTSLQKCNLSVGTCISLNLMGYSPIAVGVSRGQI
jgi:hypothetical protein